MLGERPTNVESPKRRSATRTKTQRNDLVILTARRVKFCSSAVPFEVVSFTKGPRILWRFASDVPPRVNSFKMHRKFCCLRGILRSYPLHNVFARAHFSHRRQLDLDRITVVSQLLVEILSEGLDFNVCNVQQQSRYFKRFWVWGGELFVHQYYCTEIIVLNTWLRDSTGIPQQITSMQGGIVLEGKDSTIIIRIIQAVSSTSAVCFRVVPRVALRTPSPMLSV